MAIAGAAERLGGGLALPVVDVAQPDMGALAGEAIRDGAADAVRRAGDDRNLSLEATHFDLS